MRATPRVYIRFGEPPEGGLSRNWYAGEYEGGLSVFRGYSVGRGRYVIDPGEDILTAISLFQFLVLAETRSRAVYLADGREVGVGSSGEPLLADFTLRTIPRSRVESLWEFPASWERAWRRGEF